jgi:serine/threonine protein phosphatase PrpC
MIAGLSVLQPHGEGDWLVTDTTGETRLLVLGSREAVSAEAGALSVTEAGLPSVIRGGHTDTFGDFVVLSSDLDGGTPLLEARPSFDQGLRLVRQVLDIAEKLERRGYSWEPAPTDLYLREGALLVARARGARRLSEREPLNAKRVMEALACALLPTPFDRTTPEIIRYLLPRMNFSTPAACTIDEVRAELARAEELAHAPSTSRVAERCDPGLRRPHGEDATATATEEVFGEAFDVMVVCDGVSSSSGAGEAARLASRVARDAIVESARSGAALGAGAPEALTLAIREAHRAVCVAASDRSLGIPPGSTIVAAIVFRRTLTVAWLGDSRAYWLSEEGSELCTMDHSWWNEAVAGGSVSPAEAMDSPYAHALTRCLGPLEATLGPGRVEPDARTRKLTGKGFVVLCTDGLWNYFPAPEALEALVRPQGTDASSESVARLLVCRALAEGGGDNVSVAICRVG